MTRQGGSADDGVVFDYDIKNDTYSILHDFKGGADTGRRPITAAWCSSAIPSTA